MAIVAGFLFEAAALQQMSSDIDPGSANKVLPPDQTIASSAYFSPDLTSSTGT